MSGPKRKPEILLHICCAGCGAYVSGSLKDFYEVILFFYNPNIFPAEEYEKRKAEAKRVAVHYGLRLVTGAYDHGSWLKKIAGHEKDRERGERCRICYRDRLAETAKIAKARGIGFFATTLTVSPHKDARLISEIGRSLARIYGPEFLDADYNKGDGFKKGLAVSKNLGLYRQNYCGCEFSR